MHVKVKYYSIFLSLCVLSIAIVLGYISGKSLALNQLDQELVNHSAQVKKQLEFEFNRYANVAAIYSENRQIRQFMQSAQKDFSSISNVLLEVTQSAGALDAYLLSPRGFVVASSNYQQENSFIGNEFSFREYFKQALAKGTGLELAVGKVSYKRGIYFSKAVKAGDETIGVLVIKADVASMEQRDSLFPQNHFSFMLQDSEGVIFLSDKPSWRLHLFAEDSANSGLGSQSSHKKLAVIPTSIWRNIGFSLWTIRGADTKQYLMHTQAFGQYPWRLTVLAQDDGASKHAVLIAFICGVMLVVLMLLTLFFYERGRNNRRLQRSHQRLTEQVALRTKDLTTTNKQLRHEIAQRTQAEDDLIATQEQLIQAAKLATIGELSSSINHELNQPIAALSSYLQLTQKMLEKGLLDQAATNIDNMNHVVKRLNAIVSQFKNFSRKTNEPLQQVALNTVVDNAIAIVGHHIVKHHITLDFEPAVEPIIVIAEPIQLEQVVINILTNAVDALKEVSSPSIAIRLFCETQVVLQISDNGNGIEPHYLNKIFEPFFTTKSVSGLGLGLSISRRIIESFHGELKVDNSSDGGAIFQVRLPINH